MDIVRNCFQNIDRKYDFYNRLRITALSIGARYYNRLQISATRIVDTVFSTVCEKLPLEQMAVVLQTFAKIGYHQ